jgi:hypothetical protein
LAAAGEPDSESESPGPGRDAGLRRESPRASAAAVPRHSLAGHRDCCGREPARASEPGLESMDISDLAQMMPKRFTHITIIKDNKALLQLSGPTQMALEIQSIKKIKT